MNLELALVVPVALAAALGTLALERYGRRKLLDVPNERSSHTRPVPRGGGVAIVAAFLLGCTVMWQAGRMPWPLWAALALGGGAIAIVGFWDDHRPLSARLRFLCHLGGAVAAVALLGPVDILPWFGATLRLPPWLAWPVSVAGVVWLLNLYNFMDGIDGIAAGEACAVALAGALLMAVNGQANTGLPLLGAAAFGFLLFNWAPARIFMGDAGSGFVGFSLSVFLLAFAESTPGGVWVWLILLAAFWVDATVTLVRRFLRGKRWYVAHRSHAYQHAARRFGRHAPVSAAYIAVTLLLLGPLAWLASQRPEAALWLTMLSVVPLAALAVTLGAGTD